MRRNIVLGVTGGIAAYKAAEIVSRLKKQRVEVDVIMTRHAQEFIAPLTFQSLSGNKTVVDMFDTHFIPDIEHIALAKKAEVLLIAPATANVIAKLAHGIADDMLTSVALASKAQLVIAPAMNTVMYDAPATQENLETLKRRGAVIIEPVEGLLACNDVGRGKMEEPERIVEVALHYLERTREWEGKKVLITAGPTQEAIDPVRYITNHSSGKMGYALAHQAALRGAEVFLVSGHVSLKTPYGVTRIPVTSADDMYQAVMQYAPECDIIIKAAAVADYTPLEPRDQKIKKQPDDFKLELRRTQDILFTLGQQKRADQILVGFAAETNDVIEHAQDKLRRKHADLIVANDIKSAGAGFAADTNIVTLLDADGRIDRLTLMLKEEAAAAILNRIEEKRQDRSKSTQ